jgi:hypothetical protein
MVKAIGAHSCGRWETLPPADAYGWRFLIRHLRGAGRTRIFVRRRVGLTSPRGMRSASA